MSPLAIQILRRLTALAITLAVALILLPRLLTEVGVLGPTVHDEIDAAARGVAAASTYGARDTDPPLAAAVQALEHARQLEARGKGHEARRAAREAQARAVEAQRYALAARDERRRKAEAIVADIDKMINGLEDLYGEVTPGLDKATVGRLLSLMKDARQTGAAVVLAYEQGNYEKVVAEERGVRDALGSVREVLLAVKMSGAGDAPKKGK